MSELKKIATRDGFGKEIVELGREDPNLLVVDIDIGKSCKTTEFRKELLAIEIKSPPSAHRVASGRQER